MLAAVTLRPGNTAQSLLRNSPMTACVRVSVIRASSTGCRASLPGLGRGNGAVDCGVVRDPVLIPFPIVGQSRRIRLAGGRTRTLRCPTLDYQLAEIRDTSRRSLEPPTDAGRVNGITSKF